MDDDLLRNVLRQLHRHQPCTCTELYREMECTVKHRDVISSIDELKRLKFVENNYGSCYTLTLNGRLYLAAEKGE